MKITDLPSSNFDSREGHEIDMLVLHYTGMPTARDALERMRNPDAKVSAHYMVDEDGAVVRLVPEKARAWHAGLSYWRGHTNINQRSIGIEIVNPGHEFGYWPFPAAQMKSVAVLCRDILARHDIPPRNVVAHSDIAPARKEDPGELFDWQTLAKLGIGLWPQQSLSSSGRTQSETRGSPDGWSKILGSGAKAPSEDDTLKLYGYDTADLGKAITAFQRHFRPKSFTGQWDSECSALLAALLAMV